MPDSADFELTFRRVDDVSYEVSFRFTLPGSDADTQEEPVLIQLDLSRIKNLPAVSGQYGKMLSEALFSKEPVSRAFVKARANAATLAIPLRLRLVIGANTPELQRVRWETLLDPETKAPLATSDNLYFTRYLTSPDYRPVRQRSKSELRALALIANPAGLAEYGLDDVDVEGETRRIKAALKNVPLTVIPSAPGERASLANLMKALYSQEYDILYLVAHGKMGEDDHTLFLVDDAGNIAKVRGRELEASFGELHNRPRLVILVSCETAGNGRGDPLAGLGPRLAKAGIPAVLAMQDVISMETAALFMEEFFEQVKSHGEIDHATGRARRQVQHRDDAWVPVLYLRLKSGKIWYQPGFGDKKKEIEQRWPSLLTYIENGECTPILGHGLVEPLFGSLQEVSRRWASEYDYPLAPYEREAISQVAQFLAINLNDPRFPYTDLANSVKKELYRRFGDALPPDLRQGRVPLDRLVEAVGEMQRAQNPCDPHQILASLPIPLYITTNLDNLLVAALKANRKDPRVILCPWNQQVESFEGQAIQDKDYIPTVNSPLVYHLFGRMSQPDSVVLTEDDYFDYLIGLTRNKELIPTAVRKALAKSALLFLGFQIDDWNFRVLFRSILSGESTATRARYGHIAAQIQPDESRITNPERARLYLEKSLQQDAPISLYWGSVQDFCTELYKRWNNLPVEGG